jgi:hypothetical protein
MKPQNAITAVLGGTLIVVGVALLVAMRGPAGLVPT